jgi:two-component system chemotaxis sensor kinase CheA
MPENVILIGMENFKQQFKEEAIKLFANIENCLAQLRQKNNAAAECTVTVYRAFHSLKGGGAMFGFPELSIFNEHLESIIYSYKENKTTIPDEILSIIEESISINRDLLDEKQQTDASVNESRQLLVQKILSLESNS